MPKLVTAFQSAPGQASSPVDDRSELISEFREIVSGFQSECVKSHDYFSSEVAQGKYFQSVPAGAVSQVGNAVDGAFLILGQLISSVPIQARSEILDNYNRQMISEAVDSQKKICNLVDRYAADKDTRNAFRRIKEICEEIPTSYFAVPEESQPDQVLQDINEPEEPSGTDNQ